MCISRTGRPGKICPNCIAGKTFVATQCSNVVASSKCHNPNLLFGVQISNTDDDGAAVVRKIPKGKQQTKKAVHHNREIEWSPRSTILEMDETDSNNNEQFRLKSPPNGSFPLHKLPLDEGESYEIAVTGSSSSKNKRPLCEIVNVSLPRKASWKSELTFDSDKHFLGDDAADDDQNEFTRIQLHLQYNDPTLIRVHLDNCLIGDLGAAQLGEAMLFNVTVQEIRLVKNNISAKGASDLCKCLQRNKDNVLQRLNLSSNPLGDKGIVAIANFIQYRNIIDTSRARKSPCCLRSLWLMSTKMGDVGASALAKALCYNSLEEVYLSDNKIGPLGAADWASFLSTDETLQVLNLHQNHIGDEGVVSLLKEGLILNDESSLEQLILSANMIGNDAAVAIGAYLGWNPALRILDVSMNHIGDPGLKMLAMGLTQNFRLSYLNLGENWFTDSGIIALAKCLEMNMKLSSLCLNWNTQITNTGIRALTRALMTNRSLVMIAGLDDINNNHTTDDAGTSSLLQAMHVLLERNRSGSN